MRVGIDAFALGGRTGGIETYVRNLIQGLATVDPGGDYVLLLNKPLSEDTISAAAHMQRVVLRTHFPPVRVPFWHHGLTLVDWYPPTGATILAPLRERIDIAHVQMGAPLLLPTRTVFSLHDVTFERYPQLFSPDFVTKLRITIPLAVRRAAAVVTDSEFSKRDIVRRYCVPPEKVTVAPLAADGMFRPLHDEARLEQVRTLYSTGKSFILYVGNLEPHKNLATLIKAYVRLRQAGVIRHKLVLAGRKIWFNDELFAVARASGYMSDLVFTGHVSNEDVVALYNAADLFVFPSLFEGFGLPPLEAMACGTPVISSNTSSLPEVVGDAAVTVDPLDIEALASSIAAVLDNAELRAQMSRRGLGRARTFSWETTAGIIKRVYEGVYEQDSIQA